MRIYTQEILNKENQEVELIGWVANRRDHGKIIFIDLRDRSGIVQLVFAPAALETIYKLAEQLRSEFVIKVKGEVKKRPAGMENPELPTGQFEVAVKELEILAQAKTPPFALDTDGYEVGEDIRMKYRYLDLRRPRLLKNIENRAKIIKFIRDFLTGKGFIEVETPILSKSTPEGARDYLVPSRTSPGNFYALPQSPQQYKQLLMVAGIEKYFQIARCFRDEDTRGDRQPEFTQLDLEMSFVQENDVITLIEEMLIGIVKSLYPYKKIQDIPFPRISYKDAVEKYGVDRPDLRKDKNDPNLLAFEWIVDFPLFERIADAQTSKEVWTFTHNPFSAPKPEYMKQFMKGEDVGNILTTQYDIVLNGYEVGGGSIRNHSPEALKQTFKIMGFSEERIMNNFGHMIEALSYGAPPHGGIAPGIDRLVMILENEPNIRETIAFPKTGDGRDLMMDAPSYVDEAQLQELGIKFSAIKSGDNSTFQNIKALLDSNDIKYETMEHEAVYTSEQAAKMRGTELRQGAKALVFKTNKGYMMAVVSAAKEIDTEKLKQILGAESINLADAVQIKKITNCNIGSVPPFGNLFNLKIYVDKSLLENETIAFNAGSHTNSIKMKSKDYVKVVNPEIGDFSK